MEYKRTCAACGSFFVTQNENQSCCSSECGLQLGRRNKKKYYTCQYCGKSNTTLTIDHVIPKHLGGAHDWSNLVTACSFCNHQKGGRALSETGMSLMRQPKEPPQSALYIFARYLHENVEWNEFLEGW